MAGWLLSEPTKLLLDPGCGSGSLLIPAAQDDRRAEANLLGIDVDPLAIQMAKVNRRLRGTKSCELRVADFLCDPLRARPDAIACNPPYCRHQSLTALNQLILHDAFERRLDLKVSRRASLPTLFLLRALEVCADGGRIAFITPSGWLDVSYAAKIKEFLVERAQVEALILFEANHLFFPGARTTAVISLIRNGPAAGAKTKVIRLGQGELPPPGEVLAALRGDGILRVDRWQLEVARKWSRPARRIKDGIPLGEIVRIRRGIATGCNRFFVISEQRRRELELPPIQLRSCITSPRLVRGNELKPEDLEALPDSTPRWAINCHDPAEEEADTPLGQYLRLGRAEIGANGSYLARQRPLWYGLEQRGECPILFTYFNRHRARFVRNYSNAVPLNTWLVLEPLEEIDMDSFFAALKSRELMRTLEQDARFYGDGLWKLEPSELGDIVVPRRFVSNF